MWEFFCAEGLPSICVDRLWSAVNRFTMPNMSSSRELFTEPIFAAYSYVHIGVTRLMMKRSYESRKNPTPQMAYNLRSPLVITRDMPVSLDAWSRSYSSCDTCQMCIIAESMVLQLTMEMRFPLSSFRV